ncbi:MAG TPA: NUDIX hydrolase [Gemmataceae bacterium]|nr:NUDIX hydrolase [Gemmataceae bacterium]
MMASYVRQAAALPSRDGRICLVSSTSGKRWVIPKGIIEPGQTAGEAALQEAWEEAGLVGSLHPEPIGSFLYEKWCGPCHVTVFRMEVVESTRMWPERSFRDRIWLSPAEAIERLDDAGLIEIVRKAFELDEKLITA